MRNKVTTLAGLMVAVTFAIAMMTNVAAQGKGHGGGGGSGASGMGQPTGVGVDRGIGRSSDASAGRADNGRGNASDRSNGRSDAGLDRARLAADNDLRRHPNLANDLHMNANDLRADYQAALATNPNLKFGQFVAATRLAQNLGGNHPNITRAAILAGLANGDSIGRTLQNLGLGKDQANAAIKEADRQTKQSKH